MSRVRWDAIREARQILARQPVFLDTETTGLDEQAEIIEISVVDHDGAVLLDTLVRPQGQVPLEASRVHGLTDAHLRQAPTWDRVWPQVQQVLRGRVVAIYNADYDVRLMRQSNARYGLPWALPDTEFVCIMKLYARFRGERNRRTGDYRWWKLEQAGRHCRIPIPNSHRALEDTRLARAVLQHIAAQTLPGW